jgi:mannose-6-phosphate isomerase-like protein (cupin superfamily)
MPDTTRPPANGETRPWGAFQILDEGPGFKVKRITVNPGGRLSLQSHSSAASIGWWPEAWPG